MKRRQMIRYAGMGLISTLMLAEGKQLTLAQSTSGVTIQYLGHTCFLFTGNGLRILVNPFQTLGCTAGYSAPNIEADLVMISSKLLDEGAASNLPGNPRIIFEPGVYEVNGVKIQGIGIPHDREGGRRFGLNVAWRWQQGGVKLLHLGGAAAPIEMEQKILMGTPDVALIPVGGGVKAYNPQEAFQAMNALNPKVVIPTQYRTEAADPDACDLVPVEEFLQLTSDISVQRINTNKISVRPSDLPQEGTVVRVLSY